MEFNLTTIDHDEDEVTAVLVKFRPIFIVLIIATFILNLYIIIVILTNKKLRVPMNIFVVSVCVVGLVLSCFNMPFQVMYLQEDYEWKYGTAMCLFWYIMDYAVFTISVLNFICLTVIRLMGILRPTGWVSVKVLLLVLAVVWLVPLVGWTIAANVLFFSKTKNKDECYVGLSVLYSAIADVFAYMLPLVVLVGLNVRLIWELKRRLSRVMVVTSVPVQETSDYSTTIRPSTVISRIREKARKVCLKKEKKAILSLVILEIGFIVCFMPMQFIILSDALALNIDADLYYILNWLTYLNSLYNAVVLICTSDHYQVMCQVNVYKRIKERFVVTFIRNHS